MILIDKCKLINLNYYKITPNSNKENAFKHFDDLENKLDGIFTRYEKTYHNGSLHDKIAIFSDKHFDSFCKEEFFYYRLAHRSCKTYNKVSYKWQTEDFTFKIHLSKVHMFLGLPKYISYINITNNKIKKTNKLLVIYPNYKTAYIEVERLYNVLKKLPQKDILEIIFRNEEKRINNLMSITWGF